jgi:putative transposase
MVEVVQDGERLFPGRARLPEMPGGVAGVANVTENLGLARAVAGLAMQVEGTLVAFDGFAVVAQVLVGVSEAVQRRGLRLAVAECVEQVESLAAVAQRLPVIPEPGVEPANRVQGECLARQVTGGRQARPDWLTETRLPAYAPDLNPVEGAWPTMKSSLGNPDSCGTPHQLAAIVKNRLKRIQYRPALIDGFVAQTGLSLEPRHRKPRPPVFQPL